MAPHGLRFWGGISAALHALVGLLLLFQLPGRELPPPQEAIPVELVTPDAPQLAQAPAPLPMPAPPAPEPEPNPTVNQPATPEARPTPPSPPPPPPPPPPAPAPTPAPPAPTPPAPTPPSPTPPAAAPRPTPPVPTPTPPAPQPQALPAPPPPAPAPPAPQGEVAPPQQQAAAPSPPLPMPPPPSPAPPAPTPAPQAAQPAPPRPETRPSAAPPAQQPSQQPGTGRTPPPPNTAERSQSVLSTLERLRASQQQNQPPRARPSEAAGRPAAGGGAPSGTALLTAGERQGVADKISECWSVDGGMMRIDQITVEVRVDIDQGGTIRNVRPAGGTPGDPRVRAVYESARRALLDPKCSPLPLPREKILSLNNTVFRFSPRGLVR